MTHLRDLPRFFTRRLLVTVTIWVTVLLLSVTAAAASGLSTSAGEPMGPTSQQVSSDLAASSAVTRAQLNCSELKRNTTNEGYEHLNIGGGGPIERPSNVTARQFNNALSTLCQSVDAKPYEILPAYRWHAATDLTSDLGAGDMDKSFASLIAGLFLGISGFIWGMLLLLIRVVFSSDVIGGAIGAINAGYLGLYKLLRATGLLYVFGAVVVVVGVKHIVTGNLQKAFRTVMTVVLGIGMLIGLARPLEAAAVPDASGNVTIQGVPRLSPGWFTLRGIDLTNQLGETVAGGFLVSNMGLTVGTNVEGPDCYEYIEALHRTYHTLSGNELAIQNNTTAATGVRDARAPIEMMSVLWQRSVYEPWSIAQLGQKSESRHRAACHMMEQKAGTQPRSQQLVSMLAGFPAPTGGQAESPSAYAHQYSNDDPWFLNRSDSGVIEDNWVACSDLFTDDLWSGVAFLDFARAAYLKQLVRSGMQVRVAGDGDTAGVGPFGPDTLGSYECAHVGPSLNPDANRNLDIYRTNNGGKKDWRRQVVFWASCIPTSNVASDGDKVGSASELAPYWKISADFGGAAGGWVDADDCQEAYSGGHLNVLGANDDPFLAEGVPDTAAFAGGKDMLHNLHGHNHGTRILVGILVLVTSILYLWSLGGLTVGVMLAQFCLLVLLMLLPVTLLLLAYPSEEGRAGQAGKRMLRVTLSLFLSKLVFTGLLIGMLQIMFISETFLSQVGLGEVFLSALVPLFAFFVTRHVAKILGLGDIMKLSGAVGFTAAAAMKAGEQVGSGGTGAAGRLVNDGISGAISPVADHYRQQNRRRKLRAARKSAKTIGKGAMALPRGARSLYRKATSLSGDGKWSPADARWLRRYGAPPPTPGQHANDLERVRQQGNVLRKNGTATMASALEQSAAGKYRNGAGLFNHLHQLRTHERVRARTAMDAIRLENIDERTRAAKARELEQVYASNMERITQAELKLGSIMTSAPAEQYQGLSEIQDLISPVYADEIVEQPVAAVAPPKPAKPAPRRAREAVVINAGSFKTSEGGLRTPS